MEARSQMLEARVNVPTLLSAMMKLCASVCRNGKKSPVSDGGRTTEGLSPGAHPLRGADTKPPHACCSLAALHGQTQE